MSRTARTSLALLVTAVLAIASAQTTHDVMMHITPVEGRPVPEFYFEPVGLLIQPGDSVRFVAASPHHTATAYHAEHIKSHRVPDGVEPFSSPIVALGNVSWYDLDDASKVLPPSP